MTNDLARRSWHDSIGRYGLVSRALHWSMAALFLWQFLGMGVRLTLGRHPVTGFMVGSHQSIGLLLFVLAVLRLAWAFSSRHERPPHAAGLVGRLAVLGQRALYLLMAVVPALAILRAIGSGRGLAFFGLQLTPRFEPGIALLTAPANALHGLLAWVLLALIAGHVAMALWHHFVWKDGLLLRMVGGRSTA